MKKLTTILGGIFGLMAVAHAYEGPSPLANIKVTFSVSKSATGLYSYTYTVENPPQNDGEIRSMDIFVPTDPSKDATLSSDGLTQCKKYHATISDQVMQKLPVVPVGSASPNKWSCGYAGLAGYAAGAFGWGSIDEPYRIKPGKSLGGFVLTSFAPPGIEDILVEPAIDYSRLPSNYEGNLELTVALKNKIKWVGKTVGPKAPPKVLNGGDFIAYLIALVNQSKAQGWIDNDGIVNSLLAKLNTAQSKVGSDKPTAKSVLGAFMNEVSAQNGKHLTSEAYALLFFNAQYAVNHL